MNERLAVLLSSVTLFETGTHITTLLAGLRSDKNVTYCRGVFFIPFVSDSQTSGFETVTDRIFGSLSVES